LVQRTREFARQPLTMRARRIASAHDTNGCVMQYGDAAVPRRGIERQNDHEPTSSNSFERRHS
jgi:hypothetical protein